MITHLSHSPKNMTVASVNFRWQPKTNNKCHWHSINTELRRLSLLWPAQYLEVNNSCSNILFYLTLQLIACCRSNSMASSGVSRTWATKWMFVASSRHPLSSNGTAIHINCTHWCWSIYIRWVKISRLCWRRVFCGGSSTFAAAMLPVAIYLFEYQMPLPLYGSGKDKYSVLMYEHPNYAIDWSEEHFVSTT